VIHFLREQDLQWNKRAALNWNFPDWKVEQTLIEDKLAKYSDQCEIVVKQIKRNRAIDKDIAKEASKLR